MDEGVNFWIKSLVESGDLSGKVKEAYKNSTVDRVLYDKTIYDKIDKSIADNANK